MVKEQDKVIRIPVNFENKPRGLYFSKAIFERLIFGGAYIRRGLSTEGKLRLKIHWASLIVAFLLCFTLYLRAIFQLQAPRGLYLEGRYNGGFLRYQFGGVIFAGGLYMQGLIFGILR